MEFFPRTMGTRPRLACEVRAEGVVAARAEDGSAVLSAVSRVTLSERGAGDAATPVGSVVERVALVAAVRKALEAVSGRGREVTLVVPDPTVRVLLLDFDELPAKAAEALPVVRFRLKKLLPFDADDAAVSYQVLASGRGSVQVLAVAMPQETLKEYESVVRDAGFEPGAVLPSTLAALAGLDESDRPALVVNAGRDAVTTAIVRGGVLLLHRTVDLSAGRSAGAGETAAAAGEAKAPSAAVDVRPAESASPMMDETARQAALETSIAAIAARFAALEGQTPAPVNQPIAASSVGSALVSEAVTRASGAAAATSAAEPVVNEVAQAVSVAAAYFEDTLETAPQVLLTAGTLGADGLLRVLDTEGAGIGIGPVRVEELVDPEMLGDGAASAGRVSGVPLGWLAGVRGALKN